MAGWLTSPREGCRGNHPEGTATLIHAGGTMGTRSLRGILAIALVALLACACGETSGPGAPFVPAPAPPAPATNAVLRWNRVAVDATGFDHSVSGGREQAGPVRASRAMAIVHIAMHDAVQAVQGRFSPYRPQQPAPLPASLDAAVAQAAHDTLVQLFPSQRATFDAQLAADLAAIPDGPSKTNGIEIGRRSAEIILLDRANDGSDNATQSLPYNFGQLPGQWRVDPLNPGQQPLGANWGRVRPFVLAAASQFRSPPPPALTTPEYAAAYDEVLRLGGDGRITPTRRTAEQTLIGLYWAYDGTPSLGVPPRLYNQIAVLLANQQGLTETGDLARFLALVNIAMADAGIACWESKYVYNYWRPVAGIREADPGTGPSGLGDGNPNTAGDPNYVPLCAPASNLTVPNFTPPFPAYPSGHATFGGAIFQTFRHLFGRDDIAFTFVSDELNGVTTDNQGQVRPLVPRSFASFTQAEAENAQSRIYLGIHWQFDATNGIFMGRQVADVVFNQALRPVP
ncbi:MAG: phosphatase PAP2 family protein [Candidatus Eremiobacterota bacterium]